MTVSNVVEMIPASAHAKLSASGANGWAGCPEFASDGSGSLPAATGTVAHQLREYKLKDFEGYALASQLGKTFVVDGYDVIVDDEMIRHVGQHVEDVNAIKGIHMVEVRVDFSEFVPDGFGTADSIIFADGGVCYVIDFKYGQGDPIDAAGNYQLLLYALGVFAMFGEMFGIKKFVLVIDQPRRNNWSECEILVDDLLAYGPFFSERAALALDPDAPATPSDKACQWCSKKATCPALRELVAEQMQIDFADDPIEPAATADLDIADVLKHVALIKKWCGAVEQAAYGRLLGGGHIDGFKLIEGNKNRRWRDAAAAEAALKKTKLKVSQLYKRTLLSPAQAETLLGKSNAIIAEHVEKPKGEPKLVPESAKGKPLTFTAADDFADDV